jgi:hypothetical protein
MKTTSKHKTLEFIQADAEDSSRHYWRLHDPFCHRLMTQQMFEVGSAHSEFMAVFFPFFREASLLGLPRQREFFFGWLASGFLAGLWYGLTNAQHGEILLDESRSQRNDALAFLGMLARSNDGRPATFLNLVNAYRSFYELLDLEPSDEEDCIINQTEKAILTGLVAAVIGIHDPEKEDFVESAAIAVNEGCIPLHLAVQILAPGDAVGKVVLDLFEHPLLKVAAGKYRTTPIEGQLVLSFLDERLASLRVPSEEQCPATDLDLVEWTTAAMARGREIAVADEDLLMSVFEETGQARLKVVVEVLEGIRSVSNQMEPIALAKAILAWHERVYGWNQPLYYGQELARLVHFVDVGLWLPWLQKANAFLLRDSLCDLVE